MNTIVTIVTSIFTGKQGRFQQTISPPYTGGLDVSVFSLIIIKKNINIKLINNCSFCSVVSTRRQLRMNLQSAMQRCMHLHALKRNPYA